MGGQARFTFEIKWGQARFTLDARFMTALAVNRAWPHLIWPHLILLVELALDFLQGGRGGAQFGVRFLEIRLRLAEVRAGVAPIVERLAPVLDGLGPVGDGLAAVFAEPAAIGLGRGLACREGLVVFGLRPGERGLEVFSCAHEILKLGPGGIIGGATLSSCAFHLKRRMRTRLAAKASGRPFPIVARSRIAPGPGRRSSRTARSRSWTRSKGARQSRAGSAAGAPRRPRDPAH